VGQHAVSTSPKRLKTSPNFMMEHLIQGLYGVDAPDYEEATMYGRKYDVN